MSHFTDAEIAYLQGQPLGRLATVNKAGQPHVVPVGFRFDAEHDAIEIGGRNFSQSKKWHDLQAHPLVAFVVDDLLPPWIPRGIEIRGTVELILPEQQIARENQPTAELRVIPTRIVSWGLDTDAFHPLSRSV